MATTPFTKATYENYAIVQAYAHKLIQDKAYDEEGFDPGGAAIYHVLFGGHLHKDPEWTAAFNAARHTPEYAAYLASEHNGSMFDDSFGDARERTMDSALSSAFANFMADHVLRLLGEQYADALVKTARFDAETNYGRGIEP